MVRRRSTVRFRNGAQGQSSFSNAGFQDQVTNQVMRLQLTAGAAPPIRDTVAPLVCGDQTGFDGVRLLVTGNGRICPESAGARLRCLEKPLRRIADSTQCHVDEPVRAAGGFTAAGCQCVILLGAVAGSDATRGKRSARGCGLSGTQ